MTHEAKPQPGTDSLSLVMVEDKNGSGTPNYGDVIRFSLTTTQEQPFVHLTVRQGGTLVAEGYAGYFDPALGSGNFGLYSPRWTGGAADATAAIVHHTPKGWKITAQTTFHVDA